MLQKFQMCLVGHVMSLKDYSKNPFYLAGRGIGHSKGIQGFLEKGPYLLWLQPTPVGNWCSWQGEVDAQDLSDSPPSWIEPL